VARKLFNSASIVGVCITRGGPPVTNPSPQALPWAGVDQGDGTAAILVSGSTSGGGGGTSAQTAIVPAQFTVSAMAAAIQISAATPASTRFMVWVTNTGGGQMWIGPSGVTNATGYPVFSGNTVQVPLGSPVPLYAYSVAGTTAATMEFQ
jgi:hypothetical protein